MLAVAHEAVADDLLLRRPFRGHAPEIAVVLGGSGTTDDIDEYSGCDLFVFTAGVPATATGWQDVRRGRHRYRFVVDHRDQLVAALAAGDDEALYLARHGQILHDPAGQLTEPWRMTELPDGLWRSKLAQRYRALRQRRASLAWSLRRGQMIAVLENVLLLVEHGLACCFYLQREPAPPSKWLFQGALRTAAGRTLREPVLDLLSSLGDLAVLGGSMNLHHNRLYQRTGAFQVRIEQLLNTSGYPVPQLARVEGPVPDARVARTPRVRRAPPRAHA